MHKRPILARRLGVFVLFNAPALHVFSSAVPGCKPVFATPMAKGGAKMPMVGLGLWKIPKDKCADVVFGAISSGYRLLDSACDYGNEVEVGHGIKRAMDEGVVKREELWVTSKLWNTYHRKEHAVQACKRTLSDLGLDYLDLYLVHFPIHLKFVPFEVRYPPEWLFDPQAAKPCMELDENVSFRETWEAMEHLQSEGLVKNIGVCNVNSCFIREMTSYAKTMPQGMAVTAFSSFGAPSYMELDMASASESCLQDAVVTEIATRIGKTPAQVALRWAVQRGTAIIPKTCSPERLLENAALFDFTLTEEDMKAVSALNKNRRFNDPGHFCEAAFNTFCPIYD